MERRRAGRRTASSGQAGERRPSSDTPSPAALRRPSEVSFRCGETAARALGEDDEVVTATLDLELGDYIRRTIFNFEKHRRIEHYRLITERTAAIPPQED